VKYDGGSGTPGTGMNLWGASLLWVNPVYEFESLAQKPAEGKGGKYLHNW